MSNRIHLFERKLRKLTEVFQENGWRAITVMAYVLNASTFHVIYLFATRMRKLFK
jgi:hypothetical protein